MQLILTGGSVNYTQVCYFTGHLMLTQLKDKSREPGLPMLSRTAPALSFGTGVLKQRLNLLQFASETSSSPLPRACFSQLHTQL